MHKNVKVIYAGDMNEDAWSDACIGKYQLIFISPESLMRNYKWHDILMSPVYHKNLMGLMWMRHTVSINGKMHPYIKVLY